MDMKLRSGVKVSLQEEGDSKLLLFDRPVRVMELSQEESVRLGSSLMKDCRMAPIAERLKLTEASARTLTKR